MESKTILSIIENLIYDGGKTNFAIFNLGRDYYIQIRADKGAYEMHCEAVSNDYVEEEAYLDAAQIEKLTELSWRKPKGEEGNFYQLHKVDSEKSRADLVELIQKTAKLVYQIPLIDERRLIVELATE